MGSERKLILLAVDGSDQSFAAVKYIGGVLNLAEIHLVLFHVMDRMPDIFRDWEKDPEAPQHLNYVKIWESHRAMRVHEFMEEARQVLIGAGAPESAVSVVVQKRKGGIARDILLESQYGCSAIVLGRQGLGTSDAHIMLGNVAGKILMNMSEVPIGLVGGIPRAGKVLIGLDASPGAARAVEFVGKMFSGGHPSVTLTHVLRMPEAEYEDLLPEAEKQRLIEQAHKGMEPVFDAAVRSLEASGIPSGRIAVKVITGVSSRAGTLMTEARHGRYGTLVVGRKGVSEVQEFYMGRVAAKLAQVARDAALWVVS